MNFKSPSSVQFFFGLLLLHLLHCEPWTFADATNQLAVIPKRQEKYLVNRSAIKFDGQSFSGFLTGNADSELFFWFFTSQSQKETDPLIVWLQGDIGTSSLKGLYENNGPFYVKQSKGTQSRRIYWAQNYNVLYLDTATGTGYSDLKRTGGGPKDLNALVSNILATLVTFFKEFNSYTNNDLYLAGDGFACQILTKLASKINSNRTIELKGLIIENGFCDPFNGIPVANHLHNLQMFDSYGKTKMSQAEREIIDLINKRKHEEAFDKYDVYIKGLVTPYKTLFTNVTRYEFSQHLLYDKEYRIQGDFSDFVTKEPLKRALNVPSEQVYHNGKKALMNMRGELMKSSSAELGRLMDLKYRVLMYYGQMNPEITPKGAFLTASSIKWCGSTFLEDVYSHWLLDNSLAGYIAEVTLGNCKGSLTWALVRNAGKYVAGEKQKEVMDLLRQFTTKGLVKS